MSMSEGAARRFRAYPELTIETVARGVGASQTLRLRTPWIELDVEADPDAARHPDRLVGMLFDYDLGFALPRHGLCAHERDPLAAYTEIRRAALLEERELAQQALTQGLVPLSQLLDEAEARSPSEFARIAGLALRQSWHVTIAAPPAILPALRRFPALAASLTAYLDDEAGHDLLVAQSLAALGHDDPRRLPLMPAARKLTQILAAAARTNPLALAVAIAGFEGQPNSDASSPFAERLARGPYPAAAKGIAVHARINATHGHAAVGKHLALALGETLGTALVERARDMALALERQKRRLDFELAAAASGG